MVPVYRAANLQPASVGCVNAILWRGITQPARQWDLRNPPAVVNTRRCNTFSRTLNTIQIQASKNKCINYFLILLSL